MLMGRSRPGAEAGAGRGVVCLARPPGGEACARAGRLHSAAALVDASAPGPGLWEGGTGAGPRLL